MTISVRTINKLANIADDFVESKLAAMIGILTILAVLWRSFR